MSTIRLSRKNEYEVIVVGGGTAGWVAAVAAARNGADTLLIERYGFLGGTATASLVGPWMRFATPTEQLITGIFEEYRQRLAAKGGIKGNTFNFELAKQIALEMVLEAGANLLLHSQFITCEVDTSIIRHILIANKSGLQKFKGEIFIDATGDGDVAASAGCPFKVGRDPDGVTQGITLMFIVGGVDFAKVYRYFEQHPDEYIHWEEDVDYWKTGVLCRAGFFRAVEEAKKKGQLDQEVPYLFFISVPGDNMVVFNTTHVYQVNPLDAWELTEAEIRLRRQVWQIMEILKELPGFEKSYLVQTAVQAGIRESRHITGEYVFNGDDVRKGKKFDDVIARGNYGIDIHSNESETGDFMEDFSAEKTYDIPYRSLVPLKIDNLLLAGRCISADHYGEAAMRIQPICMAIGEAAGTAAALCLKLKTIPRKLEVKKLQLRLKEQGANLGKI